jgi:Fic family protein
MVAQKEFNSLIPISDSIFELLNIEAGRGYFNYIDDCIIMSTQLIEMQPFQDGNKRVFRALLNLLFKKINIPPIFILEEEKDVYKSALLAAIKDKDYTKIINFYYYKICDAIVSLDINHSVIKDQNEEFKR